MHHFTFRKMKKEEQQKLASLIEKNILSSTKLKKVPHKPRAARGSRKQRDQIVFTRQDIDTLLHMARVAGNRDMVRKLTPKQNLKAIKKELLASIRKEKVDADLWNSYVEVLESQQMLAQTNK